MAVGANLEPEHTIPLALELLAPLAPVIRTSTFYRTRPLNRPSQPDFYNGVWQLSTLLAPEELKTGVLRPVEERCGRRRGPDRWAARPLDLDLLIHGDRCLATPALRLPDPELTERPFLFLPLLELAPDLVHPERKAPLASLVDREGAILEPLETFSARLRTLIRDLQ